jgi:hypothetical protein
MESSGFIDKLKNVRNNREENKIKTFRRCLRECMKRIEFVNQNTRKTECWYEIPSLIPGYPVFDINECIEFLYKSLTEMGFVIKIYLPKNIRISWGEILNKKETKKETKKIQEQSKTPKNLKGLLFKTK